MSKDQKITTDIKVPNKDLETLKIHFPHCFDKDGNFQIEKFKNNLTEKEINFSTESYGLDWLGKSYARLLASDPANTLLKADETHNALPENANSENLLIKGDNLEVLKHLANAYYEQVKMVYIDPPYNTGSDGFVYNDDRKYTVKELQNLIGIDAEKAKRILDFTKQKSNSHSAWLTFMYPRLYIAKQLLKEDGVIFISIGENEVAQLKVLMDEEIFGEENFISIVPRIAKKTSDKGTYFKPTKDYLIVFAKSINYLDGFGIPKTDDFNKYTEKDEKGFYKKNGASLYQPSLDSRPNQRYWIECPDGSFVIPPGNNYPEVIADASYIKPKSNDDKVWRWSWQTYLENKDKLIFTKASSKSPLINEKLEQSKWNIYDKVYWDDLADKTNLPEDIIYDYKNSQATKHLLSLGIDFSFSKPKELIEYLMKIVNVKKDEIIMDFFAGSGTTGEAVMDINLNGNGKRKFILVQLPEVITEKNNKSMYDFVKNELKISEPTIFDITKERLIRASTKIKKDNKNYEGDLGFKIFETTPIWEDYNFEEEQFDSSQTLFDAGKLTEDDIKALLTTWKTYDGIALTQDLESVDLSGYTAYYGNGRLYLMNKGFTTDSLKALLEKIDTDKHFEPKSIIAFGYHLESKSLREISENVKTYNNKKKSDIDFITRY
ncbi:MAG: site-specific DNA-methyltransferase [Bacteriodetes bacterium]|nr:site-specific DNA-methyltransferase [Bacteroidota bacterium]